MLREYTTVVVPDPDDGSYEVVLPLDPATTSFDVEADTSDIHSVWQIGASRDAYGVPVAGPLTSLDLTWQNTWCAM